MSPPPEEMISWVLEELGLSGAEGVPIVSLFDGVNEHLSSTSQPCIDESTKDSLWKSLVAREDVGFIDESKGAVLRTLTYQYVLALDFGDRKINLRNSTPPQPSNGNLVQQLVQTRQSSLAPIPPTQTATSVPNALVSSLGEHTPPPAARASLDPIEATPHSVAGSLQHTALPIPKRKGRKAKASNPKPVERKTDRTWISKVHHATQEDADRQADALEYEAGISRVYINPPGSARPELLERSEEPEDPEQRKQSEQTRKKKPPPLKQTIAVFKSLNLMDSQWLGNRMGTWRPAYNARKAELAASDSPRPALPAKPKKGKPKANRAVEVPAPTSEPPSNQAEAHVSEAAETATLSESTSRKRKVDNASDVNSINGDGGPPEKRADRRESITLTNAFSTTETAPPIPHAANVGANHDRATQSPFQSQASPISSEGQQTNFAPPQSAHTQQYGPHPQLSSQPIWNNPAAEQYYRASQNDSQNHNFQHGYPGSMPGLQYGAHPQPFNPQRPPPTHFDQQIHDHPGTHQSANPQPAIVPAVVNPAVKIRVSRTHIDAAEATWYQMRCDELRFECQQRGLAARGLKSELVTRLSKALFELDEGQGPAVVHQPSLPQPVIQQPAPKQTILQQPTFQQPVIQEPEVDEPAAQQPSIVARPDVLSKLTQNTPRVYQSPYTTSGSPADKSAPTIGQSNIGDKNEEPIQPKRKRGRPKKNGKGRPVEKATDSHHDPEPNYASPQPTSPSAPSVPKKHSPVDNQQGTKRLTRAAMKGRGLQATPELNQAKADSTAAAREVENTSSSNLSGEMPLAPESAQRQSPMTGHQTQAFNPPQKTSELLLATTQPAYSPEETTELQEVVVADAEAVTSPKQISELPQPVAVQDTPLPQQITELPQLVTRDAEQSFVEHFQKSSTPTFEVPSSVQSPGYRFLRNSDAPENAFSQPTQYSQPHLPPQVPLSDSHLNQGQSHVYSQYTTPEQTNIGAQMHFPHAHHDQRNPYLYSPSTIDGQSNLGVDPYAHHAQDTAYPRVPYQAPPPWNGHLQQQGEQGMHYQSQPRGPPLGYFSSSSPRTAFPTPMPLPSTSSATQKNRKRSLGSTPAPSEITQQTGTPAPGYSDGQDVDSQSVARKPYKSTLMAEIEAMEENLARFSSEAEAVVLPDITARLFASYNNVVGNLVLSKDKTELTFRALDPPPAKPSVLTLQASQITENPNVSMKKSRPMELRLKYKGEDEEEVLCRFYFGQTEAAYQAANEMRAAIVRARIICRAAAGQTDTYKLFKDEPVANIEIVKPWECDTCDKRFKNKEGVKYHKTLSNTTCNPNYVPPTKPLKPAKIRKPKKTPIKTGAKRASKRVKRVDFDDEENNIDEAGDLLRSVEHDDSSDSDSGSDDSILLWAEKVAFTNPGTTVKSAPPTPKKVAAKKSTRKLPAEEKILSEILEDFVNSTTTDETIDAAVEDVLRDVVEEAVDFNTLEARLSSAAAISGGQGAELHEDALLEQVKYHRSKDVIMDLVNGNFGIFPGDNALWFAFVSAWLQKHARFSVLPSSKLCDEALDQLVREKALITTTFLGRENDSMAPTRTIVTLPTVDLDSPGVEKLRELIQMAYPRSYVPSKLGPSTGIFKKLQNFIHGPLTSAESKTSRKRQDYSKLAAVSQGDSDYEHDIEDDYSLHSEDILEDFEEDEGDSDDEYYEDGPRRPKPEGNVARKKQGQRMKNYWAASKAIGSNVLTKTGIHASIDIDSSIDSRSISRSPEDGESLDANAIRRMKRPSMSRFGRPKARPRAWKSGPIPPEEKERRRGLQANRLLNLSPTFLPNADTGAWDQAPLYVKPAPKPRTRVLRYQLPEPITYLQSENGAWETRAYGHGAPPIHARPARRADGNPGFLHYLKRISQGHRPILWPAENATRVFLPAPPSKALLRTGKLPRQSRKRSKGNTSDVATSEDEDIQPKPTRRSTKRKSTSIVLEDDDIQHTPKRRRTKAPESEPQQPLADSLDPDFHATTNFQSPSKITLRMTRNAKRGGQEVDAIQRLDFFRPRVFSDFEKSPNPGLISLPVRFWLTNANAQGSGQQSPFVNVLNSSSKPIIPMAHTPIPGLKGIEKVAAWEQGPAREMLTSGAKATGLTWINHSVDAMESSFDTETMKLKWYDSAAFKIEDLPYEDLDNSEDLEAVEKPAQTKNQAPKPPKKRQWTTEKKKPNVLRRRRLTAWPSDFDGVVDNIDEVRKELEIELAPQMALYNRNIEGTMSNEEEVRLLVAVIVVMTLTGGIEKSIDWVLLSSLFPNYAANYLQKSWTRMLKNQKALIDILAQEFQDAFLLAYETGEVPEIDYDHLVDYDWGKIVDWAVKKIYSNGRTKDVLLPNSRKELKKFYDVKGKDSGLDKARESYFNPSSAIYKRMEIVAATAHTLPAQIQPSPKSADDIEIDEFTLAKSWVRALCFTPEGDYDMEVAQEKMEDLGNDLVNEAKEALVEDKVIRHQNNGRAAPGRLFEPTEVFFAALRHHITEQQFVQAVAFKKFLDSEFASGKEFVRSDYMANEGAIMCVTNLQAYGRLTLKAVDVPMRKFGLTDGGYETSKIPKERFRFNMDIYPTSSYLFDEEIPELQEYVEPPRGGEAGEIPLWYGITEDLIPDIWKRVLVAVAGTTALRAGASVASLESIFKPALEGWEIWRLMEWGVQVGLMKRLDEAHEGWTMGEWWWVIVGRFCDDE